MITIEQRDEIINLVESLISAENSSVWEQCRWDSSKRALIECQYEINEAENALEEYLEGITERN